METREVYFHDYYELLEEQQRLQKLSSKEILVELKRLRMPYEHWNLFINGAYIAMEDMVEKDPKEAKDKALREASGEPLISLEKFQQLYQKYNKIKERTLKYGTIRYYYTQETYYNWEVIIDNVRPFGLFMKYFSLLDNLGYIEGLKGRIEYLRSIKIKNKNDMIDSLTADYEDIKYMMEENNIELSTFPSKSDEIIHYIISKLEEIINSLDEVYEGLETEKEFFKKVFTYIKANEEALKEEIMNIRNCKYCKDDITKKIIDSEYDYLKNVLYNDSNDFNLESTIHMLRVIASQEASREYDKFHALKETIVLGEPEEETDYLFPEGPFYAYDGTPFSTIEGAAEHNKFFVNKIFTSGRKKP